MQYMGSLKLGRYGTSIFALVTPVKFFSWSPQCVRTRQFGLFRCVARVPKNENYFSS